MLFDITIRRELQHKFFATSLVLIAVISTIVLIRYLGQASKGNLNPGDIFLLLFYATFGRLAALLTLALFLSIVSILLRMYRDSEMIVWYASGLTPTQVLRSILRFSWPVLLVIGLFSIIVWPETVKRSNELRNTFLQRGDTEKILPGIFQESADGKRTFFVDKSIDVKKPSGNIFISDETSNKSSITTAFTGQLESRLAKTFLALKFGEKITHTTNRPEFQVTRFDEYWTKILTAENSFSETPKTNELTTKDLFLFPTNVNLGELSSRIGIFLSAVNLIFLAVAFSNVSSRSFKNTSFAFMILVFVIYNNLINLGQAWISSGVVDFLIFLISLHSIIFFVCLLKFLNKNYGQFSFRK